MLQGLVTTIKKIYKPTIQNIGIMLPTSRRRSFTIFIKVQIFKTHDKSNKTILILNKTKVRRIKKARFFKNVFNNQI